MGKGEIWTEPVLGLNRKRLVDRCRQALSAGEEGSFIYLLATRALLDHVTARILDGSRVCGCQELRLFLFDGLVRSILKQAGDERRLIRDDTKYFLLERVVSRLLTTSSLRHISPIALLPGTIESVGKIVGEIKRAGMNTAEFRQFVNEHNPHPRDQDIASIYEAYQQALDDKGLMDSEEATARALEVIRNQPDKSTWLDQTKTLFIDGFFDFTPIQKDLLTTLIDRVPEVLINLTYDPADSSVFEEPLRDTFQFFRTVLDPVPTRHFRATRGVEPGLAPLRKGLFSPVSSASPLRPPIRILSAANLTHEVREVAKEIKRLIMEDGVRPEEIAVIVREPSGYLHALREALAHMGLPSATNIEAPLASVPSVKAALRVLDCCVRREVTAPYLALLKNDYLERFSSLLPDAAENAMLAVGVQIPIRQWRERVKELRRAKVYEKEKLSERFVDEEEIEREDSRLQRRIDELDGALKAVDGMREVVAEVPEHGSLPDLVNGFLSVLQSFRLQERLQDRLVQAGPNESHLRQLARDLRGLEALHQGLEELNRVGEPASGPDPDQRSVNSRFRPPGPTNGELSIGQFYDLISHLLARTSFLVERGDPDGVRLLEATQARGLVFRVVFIAGLIEGKFPMSPERDWVYPYPERGELAEAGLLLEDLSPKLFEAKEEHLFYHAACQATNRLYLTFPRAKFTGEENVVSSFIQEVQRLYHDGDETLIPVEECNPSSDKLRTIGSIAEMERTLLSHLYQTTADDNLVLHLYNHAVVSGILGESIFARLRIIDQRHSRRFGPFDGLLSDPAIRLQLARRFGPSHVYSPTQLSTYGRCPFKFFCRRVLRLEEREEASLDLVALERGGLLHSVLHEFLQCHRDENLIDARKVEYEEEMRRIAEERFKLYEQAALPIHAGLWELQKEEIQETLRQFLDAEISYQQIVSPQGVQPHWLELGFGMMAPQESYTDSCQEYLELKRDKDVIRLRGRVDRVDRSTDKKYIVYDYKSGVGSKVSEMRDGIDLQLQMYIKALEALFLERGEEVIGGGYYSLKDLKRNRGLYRKEFKEHTAIGRTDSNMTEEEWKEVLDQAEEYAWNYVDAIREGDFRVQPKGDAGCSRCLYQSVCRYEKHRIQAKMRTENAS